MSLKITQSMMKDFADYKAEKLCGLQFVAKYIDGVVFPPSDAQAVGQWFEYKATGSVPKSGIVPEMNPLKSGELPVQYRRMQKQVENLNRLLDHYGFKIIYKGQKLHTKDAEGTLDIEAVACRKLTLQDVEIRIGDRVIIDLKCTGLLYDKWNEMGWAKDVLADKEKTMLQAVHYKWLARQARGVDVHFMFAVFSNTNEVDHELFYIQVDEARMEQHEQLIKNAKKKIQAELSKGFLPLPNYKTCAECPVKEKCPYSTDIPAITPIYY